MSGGLGRLLLFAGLALLLGGVGARRWLGDPAHPDPNHPDRARPSLGWLGLGLALLFGGAALGVLTPLAELGSLSLADVWAYLGAVEAGRAAVLLLLAATLLLAAEVQRLPGLVLAGLGLWAAWGLAGTGHGNLHGSGVRGWHALHAAAMSVWVGGVWALLLTPAPSRVAVARRFSPLAAAAAATLVLTGVGMAFEHVPSLDALRASEYGQTLLLKLLAVGATLLLKLLAVGATLLLAGAVRRSLRGRGPGRRLWAELALLLVVLALSARLAGLPLIHG